MQVSTCESNSVLFVEADLIVHWTWVKTVLHQRDCNIKTVKLHYQRCEQKFGLELPKMVKCTLEINEETSKTFWRDAIQKKIRTVFPELKILDEGAVNPIGNQQIPCHLLYDFKMDFTRKARLVAGSHVYEAPLLITYESVVSSESVCIVF
jgi:hypothetical protein